MSAPVNHRLPEVDTYISRAKPFAQPLLTHLREAVHRAVPEIEEAMKWSMPFFVYRGVILANMAGHKEHASFGLWGRDMVDRLTEDGVAANGNMGSLGRIHSLEDLPPTAALERYLREAAALIASGARTKSIQRVAKPAREEPQLPVAFEEALRANRQAAEHFAAFSPSCRREYIEWIAEAKREDTRSKRVAAALLKILSNQKRVSP